MPAIFNTPRLFQEVDRMVFLQLTVFPNSCIVFTYIFFSILSFSHFVNNLLFLLSKSLLSNLPLSAWLNCAKLLVAMWVVPQHHQPKSPSSYTPWSPPQRH